ncbi:MAG: hypothetical protein ABIR94_15050, partial [Rubrivivax sp.]
MKRPLLSLLFALLLQPLLGCGGSSGVAPPPASTATIKYFQGPDSCGRLEAYLEDTAEAMMRAQLAGSAVPFGVVTEPLSGPGTAPVPAPAPSGSPPAQSAPAGPTGEAGYS